WSSNVRARVELRRRSRKAHKSPRKLLLCGLPASDLQIHSERHMNNVALAILAHPDDAEFLCAGSLVRLRQEKGWSIHIASMTPGDCGSAEHGPDEIARIRRGEGAAAAAAIGAAYHCLEERDLRVVYNEP